MKKISIFDKKLEVKNQNAFPQIRRKTDCCQSINSPIDRILFLQRTIGNQAVQRLKKSGTLEAKLRIGQPGDVYEQEADKVAEQVMRLTNVSKANDTKANDTRGQPKYPKCLNGLSRLLGKDKNDEKLREKETHDKTLEVTPHIESNVNSFKGSGQPLPESTRAFFEPRFGRDFSQVRVHTDAKAVKSAGALNAEAYNVGQDVVFGEGQYAPGTRAGQKLMAHELVHVIQQDTDVRQELIMAQEPNTGSGGVGSERGAEGGESGMVGDKGSAPGASPPTPATSAGVVRRMISCPPRLTADKPVPSGWKPYQGDSSVFHCGFRGILEDRAPTANDLQNECFYDHSGLLVDENHPYAGCRGTPNRYDSRLLLGGPHLAIDPGGIVRAGGPAFITSRVYDINRAISSAIQVVSTARSVTGSIVSALGEHIALGVLTGVAIVDPGNWRFQGLPVRSVRHLNVMGGLLGSMTLSQNPDALLSNLTRRLDSFPISGLLGEMSQDIDQTLQIRGVVNQRITSSVLGELSLLQLVGWLNENRIVQYLRPPGDIAREQLAAQWPTTP